MVELSASQWRWGRRETGKSVAADPSINKYTARTLQDCRMQRRVQICAFTQIIHEDPTKCDPVCFANLTAPLKTNPLAPMFNLGIDKHWYSLSDSPEYTERKKTPFVAPNITVAELHAAVPPELFRKSTFWGLFYVSRAVLSAYVLYLATPYISLAAPYVGTTGVWSLWASYWWTQGLVLGGWWCLAHEAGHGNLTNSR